MNNISERSISEEEIEQVEKICQSLCSVFQKEIDTNKVSFDVALTSINYLYLNYFNCIYTNCKDISAKQILRDFDFNLNTLNTIIRNGLIDLLKEPKDNELN